MPAGKQLFIGYLNPAQLAVTGGAPGSVERLVSTGVPLTCTTQAPPANHRGPVERRARTRRARPRRAAEPGGDHGWLAVAWCVGTALIGFGWARAAYDRRARR